MKHFFITVFLLMFFLTFNVQVHAVFDTRKVPNNKVGIHILFPEELPSAAKLVNSSGGEWGYVTIPIQVGDLNIEKWQGFMDEARRLRLIPIVRAATEPYYKNTSVWRKPTSSDMLDFANFLDSLLWPTEKRYVILFNEVNRFDEWGGEAPNPAEYARLVDYASRVFERKSSDFFIITAGLDNASPNDRVKYMDNMVYLREMEDEVPGVFEGVDGISSHSYPNPAFSQPPSANKIEGTATYKFENALIESLTGEKKPVFLTETGWDAENLGEEVASSYLQEAMSEIWLEDEDIIAVTPFLLDANAGPFAKFGFIKNGEFNKNGTALVSLPKEKGAPILSENKSDKKIMSSVSPIQEFAYVQVLEINSNNTSDWLKSYFKTILGVN